MRTLSHPRVEQRGILNSTYKNEIRNNVNTSRLHTLSRFKNRIKKSSASTCCDLATTVRVSLFFVAMVLIVF